MNDRNNQYAQSMFTNMQNSEGGFFNNNPPPKLGEKSITENGTYTAKEDKLDGYSSVTADVAGGGGANVLEITLIYDDNSDTVTSTTTFSEALETLTNGGVLSFIWTGLPVFITPSIGYFTVLNSDSEIVSIVIPMLVGADPSHSGAIAMNARKWTSDNTFTNIEFAEDTD